MRLTACCCGIRPQQILPQDEVSRAGQPIAGAGWPDAFATMVFCDRTDVTSDPFIHLPHLQGRLTPCERSELRMTPQRLAVWDQRARDAGLPADWRLADHVREATRTATMLLRPGPADADLWVYAYGSLMWDPGIHFSEVRLARIDGFQRRFNYRITSGRGSPQCPALMLTLTPRSGRCTRLAFRVPAERAEAETTILWRREMVRGGYAPQWQTLNTPQGDIQALVFAANCSHPEFVGELPLDQTAAMVAAAAGPLGSNRAYLESLHAQLAALGITDTYVEGLLAQVQARDRR
jgi:cation transport protein ChaC